MLDTVKSLFVHQYDAALSMLNACVDRCPETVWQGPVANYPFRQVVLHTLFWTDYYLGPGAGSARRPPFHEWLRPDGALVHEVKTGTDDPVFQHDHLFGDSVRLEGRPPARLYDKAVMRAYLDHCRVKAAEVIEAETTETLRLPDEERIPDFSRAELHIYNIRHIEHHASQLILRLRLDTQEGIDWAGSGWREPALLTDRPG